MSTRGDDEVDGGRVAVRHDADDSHKCWFFSRMFRSRNEERDSGIGGNVTLSDDKPVHPRFETRNSESGIEIERLFLYPKENASNHNTDKYDLAAEQNVSVLRRSGNFYMAIHAKSRPFDLNGKDKINVIFEFGKNASVPKDTKVVIPINTNKSRLDSSNFAKWDAVVYRQTGNSLILQVR